MLLKSTWSLKKLKKKNEAKGELKEEVKAFDDSPPNAFGRMLCRSHYEGFEVIRSRNSVASFNMVAEIDLCTR